MRPSNMFRIAMRGLFSHRKAWAYGLLYVLTALFCLLLLAKAIDYPQQGIFDLLADIVGGVWGSTNTNMFIFVAIPFIGIIINEWLERHESGAFVIKSKSRFRMWHMHVLAAVGISFLFTCLLLIFSFTVGGIFVGFENTWTNQQGTIGQMLNDPDQFQSVVPYLSSLKIVSVLFVTKFLGCLSISLLTLFIRQFLKSGVVTMMIIIVIAGIDTYFSLPFPIFTRAASLSFSDWVNPMSINYHVIYLVILSLVLYGVTGWLYGRKDFLA